MKKKPITAFTDEELVEEFSRCAHLWGEAVEWEKTSQAGKMVFRLRDLGDELRRRGPAARIKLAPLMESMDPGVRYYAAHDLLALLPERSKAAIASVGNVWQFGVSFTARMTLANLEDGVFTPT